MDDAEDAAAGGGAKRVLVALISLGGPNAIAATSLPHSCESAHAAVSRLASPSSARKHTHLVESTTAACCDES